MIENFVDEPVEVVVFLLYFYWKERNKDKNWLAWLAPKGARMRKLFVQNSYSQEKWKRLEEIRKKYDPDGVFFGYLGGL